MTIIFSSVEVSFEVVKVIFNGPFTISAVLSSSKRLVFISSLNTYFTVPPKYRVSIVITP